MVGFQPGQSVTLRWQKLKRSVPRPAPTQGTNAAVSTIDKRAVTKQRLEFRPVRTAQDSGAAVFEYNGREHYLGEAVPFTLQWVYASKDALGGHALGIEIKAESAAAFEEWTRALVNRQIAILCEGKILTMPMVNEALPGKAIINGGANGFTLEELENYIKLLTE